MSSGSTSRAFSIRPYSEGTLVADGTEQILLQRGYDGSAFTIEGYLDTTNLIAGETIMLRAYVKIKSGGGWILVDDGLYLGPIPTPLMEIWGNSALYGVRLTLEQTAGVMRAFDYQFFAWE